MKLIVIILLLISFDIFAIEPTAEQKRSFSLQYNEMQSNAFIVLKATQRSLYLQHEIANLKKKIKFQVATKYDRALLEELTAESDNILDLFKLPIKYNKIPAKKALLEKGKGVSVKPSTVVKGK